MKPVTSRLLLEFKHTLTRIGARLHPAILHRMQMVLNYMVLGRWMREQGFSVPPRVADRAQVFDAVAQRVQNRHVLYLEFGVARGDATQYWVEAITDPTARFYGFDSFEGLPEDFDQTSSQLKTGHFDTGGQVPQIDDPRVAFVKGWFQDTLPSFEVPEHDVLVLNMDADLYTSTRFVLDYLKPYIRPGTFVYFDDLSRPEHEPKAFSEFMKDTGLKFRIVSADKTLNRVFFECISAPASDKE